MTDGAALAALIAQERPDLVVPEIEAIATATLAELEAAGKRIPISFDARLRPLDEQTIEIEATATADHRQLGMTWSPLGMLRPPATLHVKARLVRRTNATSTGGDRP